MENPQDIIKKIVNSIYDESREYEGWSRLGLAGLYNELIEWWPPLQTAGQLDKILSGTEWDMSATKFFLYLMPMENMKAIPIMTFRFNFSTSIPEFRLQLGLFLRNAEGELVSVGYRFETPEGEGRHDFYHAQPIKAIRTLGRGDLPNAPDWLPDDYPTFPVDASDPIALLITLLVSLYNLDCLARFYPLHFKLQQHLAEVMHLFKPKRKYWEVTIKNVETFFCESASDWDRDRLKGELQKKYRVERGGAVKVSLRESNSAEFKAARDHRTI